MCTPVTGENQTGTSRPRVKSVRGRTVTEVIRTGSEVGEYAVKVIRRGHNSGVGVA